MSATVSLHGGDLHHRNTAEISLALLVPQCAPLLQIAFPAATFHRPVGGGNVLTQEQEDGA
jgi:hypothetical protein